MNLPPPLTLLGPPTANAQDRRGVRVPRMSDLPRGAPIIKLQVAAGTSWTEAIELADAFSTWCPGAAVAVTAEE